MKQIWVIANWKANKNIAEALEWVAQVGPQLPRRQDLKVAVCPEFDALEEVKKAVKVGNFPLLVGVQDLSPFPPGAYTGEEAAENLKGLADLAILGHSERRQNFGETDQMVEEKVNQALENGIRPLVCVQSAETPLPKLCKLVAYEPIFAIGSGHPDTPEDADSVAHALKQKWGLELEVLYGGSVDDQNANNFVRQVNISGLLIGKSSLDSDEFIRIVRNIPHG